MKSFMKLRLPCLCALLFGFSFFGICTAMAGAPAYVINLSDNTLRFIPDVDDPGTWNEIGSVDAGFHAGDFAGNDFTRLYAVKYNSNSNSNQLFGIDTKTGTATLIGICSPLRDHQWTGMSWDATTGTMFASSTAGYDSTLYTIDLETGVSTEVGSTFVAPGIIDIAVNAEGTMYAVSIDSDSLFQIDKTTGAATEIGLLGMDAKYAQGMDFDDESGVLYWASYGSSGEMRTIDITTGESTLIAAFPDGNEVDCLAFAMGESLPYCEGFEDAWPPEDWAVYELGTAGASWVRDSANYCEGTYSVYHNYNFSGSGEYDSWLVSPPIMLPADGETTLSFCEKNNMMHDYLYSGVLISTGSGDPGDGEYMQLYESDVSRSEWAPQEIDLSAFSGNMVYIAFNYQGNLAHEWWIDNFCLLEEHALTIGSSAGGSVSEPGEGVFDYESGTRVAILAEPEADYEFSEWTGTAVDAGKVDDPSALSTTVTVDDDYTLTANFVSTGVDEYTLTIGSSTGGSVAEPGEGVFDYETGTWVDILAEPEAGYEFSKWTGTAVDAGKVDNPSASSTTVTVDDNYTLTANFVRDDDSSGGCFINTLTRDFLQR